MPNSHTEVYVHFVWATWDRMPIITPAMAPRLYDCIRARCRDMQAHISAVGGVSDHVHVLVRIPATLSVSQIAKDIKGASGHFASHELGCQDFRWQGAYSAFSVNYQSLDPVCRYILNQERHHAEKSTNSGWELPE